MTLGLFCGMLLVPALLATWLVPALPWGLKFDPFLWPLLFVALFARNRQSPAMALILGLAHDLLSLSPLGAHALVYAIVFRLAHRHREAVYKHAIGTQIAITFAVAVAAHLLHLLGLKLAGGPVTGMLIFYVAAMALVTAILAPPAYFAIGVCFRYAGIERNRFGDYCF